MFSAIILAGGSSTRMNGINKQLAPLGGIPVVIRSAMAFQNSAMVSEIILAVPAGERQFYAELCQQYFITKLGTTVEGGATRFLSVKKALGHVSGGCKYIAIHDGARPLISTKDIERVLFAAAENGAAIAAAPVTDTIKLCKDGIVSATPDRSALYSAQTPQAFSLELYRSCMDRLGSRADDLTDDSALLELCKVPVYVVPVTACNMKITRPQDIALAQAVLQSITEE